MSSWVGLISMPASAGLSNSLLRGATDWSGSIVADVSIVVPCYGSGEWLDRLHREIAEAFDPRGIDWELILVDDASPDGGLTWRSVRALAAADERVRGIALQFNAGQFKATLCGLDAARGNIIITMDDDLQHPPWELPKLLDALDDDPRLDCVIGMYGDKKHGPIRNIGSWLVGWLLWKANGKPRDLRTTRLRAMRRPVVDSILAHRTSRPVVSSLLLQSTKRIANVEVRHDPRPYGRSGWRFNEMVRSTLDLVFNATTWPLRVFSMFGFLMAFASLCVGGYYLYLYSQGGITEPGFTSIVLLLIFFGGVQMMGFGLLGEYIDRIVTEVQDPPRWHIREITGADDGES